MDEKKRIEELEAALKPFADAFESSRYSYSKRYQDYLLGLKNFDKMPDDWPMDKLQFNMGTFRRAVRSLQVDDSGFPRLECAGLRGAAIEGRRKLTPSP